MKRLVLLFPLVLTLLNSMGQVPPHAGKGFDYSSALAPLQATIAAGIPGKPDSNVLDAFYQIADIYNIRSRNSGDSHDTRFIDSSKRYAQLLIEGAHQLGRQDFEGAGYTLLAQDLISAHADERGIVGNYQTALTLFGTWLRDHPVPNDLILERQSLAFTNIGFTYFLNKEYAPALRYCDSGILHAYPAFAAGLPLTYKARIYMALGKFDDAEAALRKALRVMSVQPMVMRWEGMDYLAGLLIQKNKPDSALIVLRQALAGDKRGYHINFHYYWLGKAWLALRRPDSAMTYARLELALGQTRASAADRLRAYELLYKTDSLLNNRDGELTWYRRWVNLDDSLAADESGKDVAEIQHKYEYQTVREAAERRQFLSEQRHQRETRLFLIFFLGLLAVTAGILAYYSVKMRRKTVELKRKNQEILDAHFKGQHFERKRVASELHDNLSSLLAATKLSIQVLDPSALPPGEQKLFQSVLDMMDTACNEVRYIAHDMMPVNLERQGLPAALESLVAKLNQTGVIRFDLTNIDLPIALDKITAFNIYSICLECCNNILRHSKATRAAIVFRAHAGKLHLLISDNGKGIPDTKKDGMGIRNVNERIEALHGALDVETSAGGTSFWFTIPLAAQELAVR
ncbi:MAG TPA: ATP-binding protein [Puia sp.]|nr:ATP-binding protein [Puia sp.]